MSSETPPPDTGVYDLLAWFEVNKKKVAIAAVVLVAVGFGIAVYRYNAEQKEAAASAALLELHAPGAGPTNAPATPPASFLKIANEFSGTGAAVRAKLLSAASLFSEGKYAEAHDAYKKFLSENGDTPWAGIAALGVAASLEAQGKMDEALQAYQTAATTYPNSGIVNEAKLSSARIYELKKQPEQALRVYNELTGAKATAGPMGGKPEAMLRKERLLKQYPHLDTNQAPSSVSAPGMPPRQPAKTGTNAPKAQGTNAPAQVKTNAAHPSALKANTGAIPSTAQPAKK